MIGWFDRNRFFLSFLPEMICGNIYAKGNHIFLLVFLTLALNINQNCCHDNHALDDLLPV